MRRQDSRARLGVRLRPTGAASFFLTSGSRWPVHVSKILAGISMWRCVIFDMDGTLTQTNQLIFDSFNHIANTYEGKRYSEVEIAAMFGPPEEGALMNIVGKDRLDQALVDYLEFYRSNHPRLAKLYPGIRDILELIRQKNRKIALFTGKGVHTATITLQEFALEPYFDCIVTGNDVRRHKPSSEGLQNILSQFGLGPGEALMVGDSVSDLKASREAKITMAAVLWDSYGKERVLAMKPDFQFHEVVTFHSWLKERLDCASTD
jgi:HAD superfamily hydrolase (TIGR01549 family)